MTKEKILSIILCFITITMFICNNIAFAITPDIAYKVEKITSVDDINSKNLYQYIFVYEDEDGTNRAFAATLASNSNEMSSRSNHCPVEIEDGMLTLVETKYPNIVWNLTKSKKKC